MRTLIILFCLLPISAVANINVVTSIEPIYQITSAIMQGVDQPKLLIKRQVSAHHFSFRPSHFTLIKNADLMIWISRDFESGLQRLSDILSQDTRRLELIKALNLQNQNGHIWYSPILLPMITDKILIALKDLDPTNADLYQSNTDQLIASIREWANLTRSSINKAAPRYILDHDFLSHFEKGMGIEATSVLHDSHDQQSGIQALREIKTALRELPVKCLLINEPSASKIAKNLSNEFNLEIHNISLLSDNHQPSLIESLNRLSAIMQHCH
jgi:zinc transport system substrate-binding protein